MHNFEKHVVIVYIEGWYYIKDNADNYLQEGSTRSKWAFAGKKNAITYITRESAEREAKEDFGFFVVKQLTVVIETKPDTLEFISRLYDALAVLRERILKETKLTEISFLPGDEDFCRTTLRKSRDYPAIAIVDHRTYAEPEPRDAILSSGATLVFGTPVSVLNSESAFIELLHDCVLVYLGQS